MGMNRKMGGGIGRRVEADKCRYKGKQKNSPGESARSGHKTVRATRAKEVRLEKPAEKHPSPGHTHVGFGRCSLHNRVGYRYGVHTHSLVRKARRRAPLAF